MTIFQRIEDSPIELEENNVKGNRLSVCSNSDTVDVINSEVILPIRNFNTTIGIFHISAPSQDNIPLGFEDQQIEFFQVIFISIHQ